uniref:Serpentine receptor class gamma n=1 Tax=Panagrolaimus davidi TaxID=227884 RepID=A0A914PAD6_9BILA
MGYLLSQISFLQPPGQYNIIAITLVLGTVVLNGVQACLHAVMAFNRLTAILFPHAYSNLWKGKYFYRIILAAFLFPTFMYSWIAYFDASISISPAFNTYAADTLKTGIPWLKKHISHAIIIGSTCVLAVIFDLWTFILLQKGSLLKSNASKYKKEFRLLTVSLAFSIVHVLFLATAVNF